MNLRYKLLRDISKRGASPQVAKREEFGHLVFRKDVFEKMLPKHVAANLIDAQEGRAKLNPNHAGMIAHAMQSWATSHGASHYCHWFQPMTGLAAEKQDAFLEWGKKGEPIETLTGKQLMRGEADASSFPSGGLRNTYEARGYTTWDPTSNPFLWEIGSSRVLCLPSIFFSWTGKALDMKIPLMRSEAKIKREVMRLCALFNIEAENAYVTLGCEQEYFLIDRSYFLARPDLMVAGRTVWGVAPSKGQELEDHYFGSLKERVAAFMTDLEHRAWALGIPLKTRHCEVAPGQFEAAPIFEKVAVGVDHNILLMELMRQVATRHHLACLMHEKPFAGINGSGKHCNWSVATDTGKNLLDPQAFHDQHLPFLVMLCSVLKAVHAHAAMIRASIATAGNDHRLGGHEAPPPIISVYLGQALEKYLDRIQQGHAHHAKDGASVDLGILALPELLLDETDRNRTSPFPFTGTKFEFRAVGSSQNPALPVTVINSIVGESLGALIDAIEKEVMKKKTAVKAALDVVCRSLKETRDIRFSGDNYSAQWRKEAKRRHLPMIDKSIYAFDAFMTPSALKAFESVFSKEELHARVEIMKERYCKMLSIEARLLLDTAQTQILPAAMACQKNCAEGIKGITPATQQKAHLKKITHHIERMMSKREELEKCRTKALSLSLDAQMLLLGERGAELCRLLREEIDTLEKLIDDALWPSPKYREMLYIL